MLPFGFIAPEKKPPPRFLLRFFSPGTGGEIYRAESQGRRRTGPAVLTRQGQRFASVPPARRALQVLPSSSSLDRFLVYGDPLIPLIPQFGIFSDEMIIERVFEAEKLEEEELKFLM